MKIQDIKIQNMTSARGNTVPNQFIIETPDGIYFQSYASVVAFEPRNGGPIQLDARTWDCTRTTAKYRKLFLGEGVKETLAKIKDGTYLLTDLN